MKKINRYLAILNLVLAIGFGSEAQASDPASPLLAGRIVKASPDSKAVILNRAGTSKKAARYGVLLYAGDRFVFDGPDTITAEVHGERVVYEPGSANAVVPDRSVGFFTGQDSALLDLYRSLLAKPRRAIPVFPYVRDSEVVASTLRPDPLMPMGQQQLPKETGRIAFVWQGGAADLQLSDGKSAERRFSSGQASWIVIELPAGPGPYAVNIPGQSLSWVVRRVDQAPSPQWFARDEPKSEAQRLVRAVWLLREGPPEWRGFALAELSEIAALGNFTAGQLWTAARAGELIPGMVR